MPETAAHELGHEVGFNDAFSTDDNELDHIVMPVDTGSRVWDAHTRVLVEHHGN